MENVSFMIYSLFHIFFVKMFQAVTFVCKIQKRIRYCRGLTVTVLWIFYSKVWFRDENSSAKMTELTYDVFMKAHYASRDTIKMRSASEDIYSWPSWFWEVWHNCETFFISGKCKECLKLHTTGLSWCHRLDFRLSIEKWNAAFHGNFKLHILRRVVPKWTRRFWRRAVPETISKFATVIGRPRLTSLSSCVPAFF